MRLLVSNNSGEFSLTKDFGDNPPRYAILSHTWGADTEEVTFRDLMDGTGKGKAGYDKIKFCGAQSKQDGIKYFWVDSCCINKSNSTELAEAINSMFRWYQNAAICYVYLSDVSTTKRKASDQSSEFPWESAFRGSKWFTRGWTLQELLAPSVVEFFSRDGKRLGDKRSLEQHIHEVTEVAVLALRGAHLSQFGVEERFSWAEHRQTTRGEDKAYSLFGMFEIQLPLIYGEGRDKAFKRLREEIYKPLYSALNKLQSADGASFDSHAEEHNARCYRGTRAETLQQIRTWASDPSSECIFWLNGMAGTGKSTISRTVAQIFSDKGELGASFFFKRGEGDRGHAGLLFTTIAAQLVQTVPSLARHIQNAIEADLAISTKTLRQQLDILILQPLDKLCLDPQKMIKIIIVVDALDECDREEDVRIIIRLLSQAKHLKSVQLKIFLTSRPELPIRLGFDDISGRYEDLALHQISESIVKDDISTFLEHELAMIRDDYNKSVNIHRRLPKNWPERSIVQSLVQMAVPLFIFATTICRFINDRKCGLPKDQLAKVLQYETKSQASKLDATYLPVLSQLLVGVTASQTQDLVEEFKQVVGSIIILARPISAISLDTLLGMPAGTTESRTDLLHSVLSIPSNPHLPIRLLHLSFRDFLVDNEKCKSNPFWINEKDVHKTLAARCLDRLSTSECLKKDICNLQTLERPRVDIDKKIIDVHLPPDIQYACQYWVYHAKKCGSIIYDNDRVHSFIKRYFLYLLEALSLIGRISESVSMINDLISMLDLKTSEKASALLYDAKRFILRYLSIVDSSPLQLYSAALIFAPKKSVVRNLFQEYLPNWISQHPVVESDWNSVLQTLDEHDDLVDSVAFSHDSKLLASASHDKTVRLWDAATGTLQQMLEGHSSSVNSVAFSHDSKLLASASDDKTVRIWDAATGTLRQTLEGHSGWVNSVAFSHDSRLLVSASGDKTVRIWDAATGTLRQTLEGHSSSVNSVAFSHDSKLLASASDDETVRIWDAATGTLQQMLEGHSSSVNSVAFSHDSKLLASASDDETVRIWDAATGTLRQTLEGHSGWVNSVAFSHDSKLLASASGDKTVRIWDAATGTLRQTLEGHSSSVNSVAFSHDSKLLASASDDKTVRIWDAATGTLRQTLEGHSSWVNSVAFSHDSKLLASASGDKTVRIWDAATGTLRQTLEGHSSSVNSVAFSHDSKLLASASLDKTVRIWDAATETLRQTLEGHSGWVNSVAFSHDSKLLASASGDKTVRIWDAATGTLRQTLEGHSSSVNSVAFSHDSKLLASASLDKTVRIWDAATETLRQTLEGHSGWVNSVAFSHDSKLLASASLDKTVRIWDAATETLRQTLEGHSGWVNSVAFSHDSKLLASASDDKTVRIWDAATGTLRQTLEGHSSWANSVAFSHDSKLLASASDDETVRIWDAATGTLRQMLEGHSGLVNTLRQAVVFDRYVTNIKFDVTDATLITGIGRIKVDRIRGPSLCVSSQEVDDKNSLEGLAISGSWITWNAQNILWLPPEFRADTSDILLTGSTVAIGCRSGKVYIIGIISEILNSYYS